MNGTRSFGSRLVLALALVCAWIPAAINASPAAQAAASAAEAPSVEELPAASETAQAPRTAPLEA